MSEPIKVEWRKAVDFAEVAEALGVPTTAIMACQAPEGRDDICVLYAPEVIEHPEDIYAVWLKRGLDGVLFVSSESVQQVGLWERIVREMERE